MHAQRELRVSHESLSQSSQSFTSSCERDGLAVEEFLVEVEPLLHQQRPAQDTKPPISYGSRRGANRGAKLFAVPRRASRDG